jgi:hypothetical protein
MPAWFKDELLHGAHVFVRNAGIDNAIAIEKKKRRSSGHDLITFIKNPPLRHCLNIISRYFVNHWYVC